MKRLLLSVWIIGATSSLHAQPPSTPVSSYVFPAGGQRGTTVPVRVGGEQLPPACDFMLQGEGVTAPARVGGRPPLRYLEPAPYRFPTMDAIGYPKEWSQQLTIAPEAPLGAVYWRLGTAQGGTSARVFVVGELPEFIEEEPNSRPDAAQRIQLPLTINGQLNPREDVDRYLFHAEKGQHLLCAVMAQRLGSVADPVLELSGPEGRSVVVNDSEVGRDVQILFTAPETGEYRLAVHDVGYSGGPEFVYRLSVESRPHLQFVYPAGGQRGTQLALELWGSGLTSDGHAQPAVPRSASLLRASAESWELARHEVSLPVDAGQPSAAVRWEHGGKTSNPLYLIVGDLPEVVESPEHARASSSEPVRTPFPVTINGRLETIADTDRYVFAGNTGQRVSIACNTRQIGSPVAAAIELRDPAGKVLGQATALEPSQSEPNFELVLPSDGDYLLSIRDLFGAIRGGAEYVYRLQIKPAQPDFELTLAKDFLDVGPGGSAQIDLQVTRRGGFDGPIQLMAIGLPETLALEPITVGSGQNQVKLTFKAAPDALTQSAPIELVGEADVAGAKMRRAAGAAYVGAPAGSMTVGQPSIASLLVTVTHPPLFRIETDDTFTYHNKGATYPALVRINRNEGYQGEIQIRIADRQIRELDGFTAGELIAAPGASEILFPVHLPETMELSRPSSRVYVLGTGPVTLRDGRVVYLLAVSPKQIVIKSTPAFLQLQSPLKELEVIRGQSIDVPIAIHRTLDFSQEVEVALAPSEHLRGVTLQPVTIPADRTEETLRLHFAADAEVGHEGVIRLQALGLRNGYPVMSEVALRVYWTAP